MKPDSRIGPHRSAGEERCRIFDLGSRLAESGSQDLRASVDFSRAGFRLRMGIDVPSTGITALIGPSGCGKTTLLRLLAGLETPQAGRIQLGDTIWFDSNHRIDLPSRKRRVGLLFQDYALFPHLSVAANIAYGLARGPERAGQVALWLERLQLQGLADRRPETLSGGQRQRVGLARALAPRPSVLLLDEPFSAIDISLRQSLRLLFQEVVADRRAPTLLVTHDLDDVRYLADRVGVLIDGELRQLGSTAEVFAAPTDAEVARVLGWHNILPVTAYDGLRASGGWGTLELLSQVVDRTPDVLAIRPSGPWFCVTHGLEVELVRVTQMDDYQALFCRLPDCSPLRIHLARSEPCPMPGVRARIRIPPECVLPLPRNVSLPDSVPTSSAPSRGRRHA